MPSKEWERIQLAKRTTVRVRFEHLNQALQEVIGEHDSITKFDLESIKNFRKLRAFAEGGNLLTLMFALELARRKMYGASLLQLAMGSGHAAIRQITVKKIQKKHVELEKKMKMFGILQTKFEKEYPSDWLNPTIVADTHPIFSVQANGDIIFRRATPKEMSLLKAQEKWVGKAGLNVWRWRGVLRRPEAPETERARFRERFAEIVGRLPERRREPALGFVPVRKKLLPKTRRR